MELNFNVLYKKRIKINTMLNRKLLRATPGSETLESMEKDTFVLVLCK